MQPVRRESRRPVCEVLCASTVACHHRGQRRGIQHANIDETENGSSELMRLLADPGKSATK